MSLKDDEIRIIHLLPGRYEDPVQCTSHIARLSSQPKYQAVSYRWDNGQGKVAICLDGVQRGVARTVYQLLRRLRPPDRELPLWVDQLCIDQEDNHEKISQIRIMGQIYKQCSLCYVWLREVRPGIPLEDARSAFEMLSYPYDQQDGEAVQSPYAWLESTEALRGALRALQSICPNRHEWWQRAWMAQEVVLPSCIQFVWGPLRLGWGQLERASHHFCNQSLHWPRVYERLRPMDCLLLAQFVNWISWLDGSRFRTHAPTQQRFQSSKVPLVFRHRKALDPRDRAFAMLGMIQQFGELRYATRVNYNNTVAEVYSAFTMDLIRRDGLCSWATEVRADPPGVTKDIPSWAIDLPNRPKHWAADGFCRLWTYVAFDACAGRQLNLAAFSAEADRSLGVCKSQGHSLFRTIALTGLKVDVVKIISEERYLFENKRPCPQRISRMVRAWMDLVRGYRLQINQKRAPDELVHEEDLKKEFCRFLMSDAIRDNYQRVIRGFDDEGDDMQKVAQLIDDGVWYEQWQEMKCLRSHICSQTFFITRRGLMGLASLDTAPGDEVWVFDGGNVPFMMRPKNGTDDGNYTFGSWCYTQGIMRGEVYDNVEGKTERDMPFVLQRMGKRKRRRRRRTIIIH